MKPFHKYLQHTCCIIILHLASSAMAQITVTASDVTITRGDSASLSCSVSGGCPPYKKYEWTLWTKGTASAKKTGQSVSAKILETCSVTVIVTDSKDITGSKTVSITVNKRSWNTAHSTASDVWTDWGSLPLHTLGENINANSHQGRPIVGETQGDWSQQITRVQVNDPNGPFNGYWYNSTHNLRVERETRINQYLKGQVAGACFNWVTLQDNFAANPGIYSPVLNASGVHAGVVAHENQGNVAPNFNTVPKQGGHSALFKAKQDSSPDYNAAKTIEEIYSNTENSLIAQANGKVAFVDVMLAYSGSDPLTGNIKTYIIGDYNCPTQAKTIGYVDN